MDLFASNPLCKQSLDLSLAAMRYCELLESQRKFIVARQLLRSLTSIGANAMESQNAESVADFIHKLKLAAKEADESQYWLLLCDRSENYPDCKEIQDRLNNLQRLINRILATTKKKLKDQN